jgi:4-coumarate--CoA ligase
VFYAVIAAGGIFSSASPSSTHGELASQVKHGRARLVLTSQDRYAKTIEAGKVCGLHFDRVLVVDSIDGRRILKNVQGINLLFEGGKDNQLQWEVISDRNILRDRAICLLYSSGTTDPPKGME